MCIEKSMFIDAIRLLRSCLLHKLKISNNLITHKSRTNREPPQKNYIRPFQGYFDPLPQFKEKYVKYVQRTPRR